MKYENVVRAAFISRPHRFIAEVELDGRRRGIMMKYDKIHKL